MLRRRLAPTRPDHSAVGDQTGASMEPIEFAIIGTGWCGGIRAEACAAHPLVKALHIAETRPESLKEVAASTRPKTAVADYRKLLDNDEIAAVFISATPETTHFPIARDCLLAGKHVFLEKPIALELGEADELIGLARSAGLKFTIGYSQRFNPKYAYVKKCIAEGTIGKPVRVYSQVNYGAMRESSGGDIPDLQWATVTLDSGLTFVVGGGWSLPPGYPNFSRTWIEVVGTDGAITVDDTHRDVMLSTVRSEE